MEEGAGGTEGQLGEESKMRRAGGGRREKEDGGEISK